jgi:hypothetical protein
MIAWPISQAAAFHKACCDVTNIEPRVYAMQIAAVAAKRRRHVVSTSMPLLSYFAVVSSVLVALLFVADVAVKKPRPLTISTSFYGLAVPRQPESTNTIVVVTPAPVPDMAPEALAPETGNAPAAVAITTQAPGNSLAQKVPAAKGASKARHPNLHRKPSRNRFPIPNFGAPY